MRYGWGTMLAICAGIVLIGCSARPDRYVQYHNHIEGTVRDTSIGVPVSGAHILVEWRASSGPSHGTIHGCTWIAGTRTDVLGNFSIHVDPKKMRAESSPGGPLVYGGEARMHVYKEGMEFASSRDRYGRYFELVPGLPVSVGIAATKGDSHERIRLLHTISDPISFCNNYDDLLGIKAYYNAIASEADTLIGNEYEAILAKAIRHNADRVMVQPAKEAMSLPEDRTGYRDLLEAARKGDAGRVAQLLEDNPTPNRLYPHDITRSQHSALVQAIEEYGYVQNDRLNPVSKNNPKYIEVVKVLLKHPVTDPNLRMSDFSPTPLMRAVELGQLEIVELLLARGADPTIVSADKTNAYCTARRQANGISYVAKGIPEKVVAMLQNWERTHSPAKLPAECPGLMIVR